VLSHKPVRIVISFGANDMTNGVPIDKVLVNFHDMIVAGRAIGADVVLGLLLPVMTDRLWWANHPFKNATVAERLPLHNAMLDLARLQRVPCFDLLRTFPSSCICIDGIHINQAGQELLALETLRLLTAAK
jgi:hypothetical protein